MRSLKILNALFLIACCACSPNKTAIQQPITINKNQYIPPTDLELEVLNTRKNIHPTVFLDQEELYRDSLVKIETTIRREWLQYNMCFTVKETNECQQLLKQFCTTDILLDSKGIKHHKPFCH